MRQTRLVAICAAAVAASPFLTWVTGSAGPRPWVQLRELPSLQALWRAQEVAPLLAEPLALQLFLASLVLGLLAALLAVLGWAPRLLVLLTGLLPVGLTIWFVLQARDQLQALGVTVPSGGMGELAPWLLQNAGAGFWLWLLGGVLLLLMGLLESPEY